jgi:hypothetical protein
VAAGAQHACALRVDGGVSCWGSDDQLQGGIPRGPYAEFSMWLSGGCGVTPNHDLVCWGSFDPTYYPGSPPVPTGKFVSVKVTGEFACAVREGGALACWGTDLVSESPPEGTFRQVVPPWALRTDGSLTSWNHLPVPPDLFRQITGSPTLGCGLRTDDKVACWNEQGDIIPTPLAGTFIGVHLLDNQLCALRADGSVSCAECQRLAQWTCQPVPAEKVAGGPFQKIGHGANCLCGLTNDGQVGCWNPAPGAVCAAPSLYGSSAVDFRDGCAMSERGALFCEQPFKSIDLDRP